MFQIVMLLRNMVFKMKRLMGLLLDGGDYQVSVFGLFVVLLLLIVGGNDLLLGLYLGKGMLLIFEIMGLVFGVGLQVGLLGGLGLGMMVMGDVFVMFNGYEGLNFLFNSVSGFGLGGG